MGLEKRYAIIVGTNSYTDEKLQYSLKDSTDIRKVLVNRCEFKTENIIHLQFDNSSNPPLIEHIYDAFKSIKTKGFTKNMHTFLFYFSGHGKYDSTLNKSFLELSDSESVSIQKILDQINILAGKNNYLFIDACQSGGELDFGTSKSRKIQKKLHYHAEGIYCIFGAAKDQDAFEPSTLQSLKYNISNGYLTHFIIEAINDKDRYTEGFLSAKAIDDYISLKTQLESSFSQVPVSNFNSKGYHPLGVWIDLHEEDTNQIVKDQKVAKNKSQIIEVGEISVGKDVIIFKSISEDYDFQLMELERFSDSCGKNYSFKSNKIILDSSTSLEIIFRSATRVGMNGLIDLYPETFKDKRIQIIQEISDNAKIETLTCSVNHRLKLKKYLHNNNDINYCLHCGRIANFYNVFLIELDSKEFKPNVGFVHKDCLRETDRVFGFRLIDHIDISKRLGNFDFDFWYKLLLKGQGFLRAAKKIKAYSVFSWYPDPAIDISYSYCLRYILQDGSFEYDKKYGSKIEKMSKYLAEIWLAKLKQDIQEFKERNNPLCFTSRKRTGGPYSQLLESKDDDEDILEVEGVEVVKYSRQFESKLFYELDNSIAPLCYIIDKQDRKIVNLLKFAPLLSNPESVDNFVTNWEKGLGFSIDDFELLIIKSDQEFDQIMMSLFEKDLIPVVDPIFDNEFNLVRGIMIQYQERLVMNAPKNNMGLQYLENPIWKSGDIVSVIFPNGGQTKPALGLLLENELENKESERVIIFKPIDDKGKEIDNVGPFVIPSKFIQNRK